MSKRGDKDLYLQQYPGAWKWLNQCVICDTIGYKPEMPEKITPGFLAHNIRLLFTPLAVNTIGVCEDCAKHWEANQ